jgi:sialate O-acetylesterase
LENRDHPRDKLDVGYRLSRSGLAVAYGYKNITYQGPIIADISVASNSGQINVTYSSVVSTSIELRNPAGFEVCFIFVHFVNFIKNIFPGML